MTASGRPADEPNRPYHHGRLRAAMIEAAVQLAEEKGPDGVTIREAARRAGVSPGAPFRHFASKRQLMTAVAEDGMARLRSAIATRLSKCRSQDPFVKLLAIAEAYIGWAVQFPTHYRIVGDRPLVDFYSSEALLRDNRWIGALMMELLIDAERAGDMRPCALEVVVLQSRALAYGLARMHVDDHLREFGVAKTRARKAMLGALRDFIVNLGRDPAALKERLDASGGD